MERNNQLNNDFKNWKISVIGCGDTGCKIAGYFINTGWNVTVYDHSSRVMNNIWQHIQNDIEYKLAQARFVDDCKGELISASGIPDAVAEADLIIEAIEDELLPKRDLFEDISRYCKPSAFLTTTTQTHDISGIAVKTRRKERVIGLQFMCPIYDNSEIMVTPSKETPDETADLLIEYLMSLGKRVELNHWSIFSDSTLENEDPNVLWAHINRVLQLKMRSRDRNNTRDLPPPFRESAPNHNRNTEENTSTIAASSTAMATDRNRNTASNMASNTDTNTATNTDANTDTNGNINSSGNNTRDRDSTSTNANISRMTAEYSSSGASSRFENSPLPSSRSGSRSSESRLIWGEIPHLDVGSTGTPIPLPPLSILPELARLRNGTQANETAPSHRTVPQMDWSQEDEEKVKETLGEEKAPPECSICLENPRNCLFNPCHHIVSCTKCAGILLRNGGGCPLCRETITSAVKVYFG